MRRTFQILLLALLALTSASVFAAERQKISKKMRKQLEETQVRYDSTLRWGNLDDLIPYLDLKYDGENPPITDLERSRFEQVKIAGYRGSDNVALPDGRIGRSAEVRVINKNTQAERVARVSEIWYWDAKKKRWLQANGLPDLWQSR